MVPGLHRGHEKEKGEKGGKTNKAKDKNPVRLGSDILEVELAGKAKKGKRGVTILCRKYGRD